MKKWLSLTVITMTLMSLFPTSCSDMSEPVEGGLPVIDREKIIDLRSIYPGTDKSYAQMLVEEIPEYRNLVMDFLLAQEYAPDYKLIMTETENKPRESYDTSTHAIYRSASTQEEIDIYLLHFSSAKSAQDEWIWSLGMYSIPDLSPADVDGIIVGDVAVGTERSLNFVRGNIVIRIRGVNGNSVVDVAKEIDAQIIEALK